MSNTLRGRNIIQDIVPRKQTLKELLIQLERNDWDRSKLSLKYNNIFDDYKLEEILMKLKEEKKENWAKIIKNRILELYGDEISSKYACIYLVGYCMNFDIENTIRKTIKKICIDNEVIYTSYEIGKIINSGISDGVYLGILNNDGLIEDNIFFKNWTYINEDKVMNSVFESYKKNLKSDYDKEKIECLHSNRFYLKKQIEQGNIEFTSPLIKRKKIKQNEKIRTVYSIQEYSLTEITLKYLKRRLDIVFNIKYSDRNKIMRKLFGLIENIDALDDYTIYKFDIEDFFNSVSSKVIVEKYILDSKLEQYEKNILNNLSETYGYCFAGLPTSNSFIEIAGCKFDEMIKFMMKDKGIVFYSRYVDDGLIILNKKVEKETIREQLKKALENCFNKNVKLKMSKENYLTKASKKESFSYLGYKFERTRNSSFLFGIEEEKINKYKKKINEIVSDYSTNTDIELLRQRLSFYISRIVFYNNDNSRYSNLGNWEVLGVSSNYCLLRKYIKQNKLINSTEKFLKSAIIIEANKATRGKLPYFLKGVGKNYYSLEFGIKKNKSIVFHPNIGWSQDYLKSQILKLGFTDDLSKKSYREYVKIYYRLIEI